jgi:hypothetical protein
VSCERVGLGAGDGNRTHVASLEGWSSTIELHPHAGLDTNPANEVVNSNGAVLGSEPYQAADETNLELPAKQGTLAPK